MLIDRFADDWMDTLSRRAANLSPSQSMYLLLDGAFVPALHRRLRKEHKAILFARLPGCTEEAVDASPFLTSFVPEDRNLRTVLQRCNRWPMVSVIETPESLEQLGNRLATWCIVEACDQRFNFRFSDTRRVAAIFEVLDPAQRAQITGPATCWSVIDRSGHWHDFELAGQNTYVVSEPTLDERQFALLVNDSVADEILALLADRGMNVFQHPSRSHALAVAALRTADTAHLPADALLDWCEWFWDQGHLLADERAATMLQTWVHDFM